MARDWTGVNARTGKTEQIPFGDIQARSVKVLGLKRTKPLGFADEALVQTIERRISRPGEQSVAEIMTMEEINILEKSGVELELQFEAKDRQRPRTTLADDIIHVTGPSLLERNTEDRLKALVRRANKFVMTESAAERVAEAIRSYPEMIADHGIFARPPFETCWIEFPSERMLEIITPGSWTADADTHIGYLFHHDRVYAASRSLNTEGSRAEWSPVEYHLNQPSSIDEQLEVAKTFGVSRMQLDEFYWGRNFSKSLSREYQPALRRQHGMRFIVNEKLKGRLQLHEMFGGSAGEIRNILGILLMINQPAGIIHTEQVPHSRMMTRKGPRVLLGHSALSINLDKRSTPARLFRRPQGAHASPRWHEVRSHWCSDRVAKSQSHEHDWEAVDDTKRKFVCRICGGRRWHRSFPNGRGDHRRGSIGQTRQIVTAADKKS